MKVLLITLLFGFLAVYIARTLDRLQFAPRRLQAFIAIALVSTLSFLMLNWPQVALYLVIASVSFYDPRYWWAFLRLWLHQWIILFSIFLFIGLRLYHRQKFALHTLDIWLGGIFLTFIISWVNSPHLGMSVKWTIYFLILVGGYFLTRLSISKPDQLINVIWFLVLCGAGTGVISFFRPTVGPRVGSLVLTNPNALGNFLTVILPLPLALLFYGRLSHVKRILAILAVIPLVSSIILTLSRSSWAGCGVGLLALGLARPRFKYFALVIAGLVVVLMIPAVKNRLVGDKDDPGVSYRRIKIMIAYEMFRANPVLGQGPGAFQALAPGQDEWQVVAHSALENLYMRILAEGGMLQAAVFTGLVIYFSFLGWTTGKRLPPGPSQAAVLGSLAAFWAALGIGIGEDILLFPMTNWLLGLYMAVIVIIRENIGQVSLEGRRSIEPLREREAEEKT